MWIIIEAFVCKIRIGKINKDNYIFLVLIEKPLTVSANLKPFLCDTLGNAVGKEWERWKRNFNLFLKVNKISNPELKKDYLLYLAGDQVQDIVEEFPQSALRPKVPEMDDVYSKLIQALDAIFFPKIFKLLNMFYRL